MQLDIGNAAEHQMPALRQETPIPLDQRQMPNCDGSTDAPLGQRQRCGLSGAVPCGLAVSGPELTVSVRGFCNDLMSATRRSRSWLHHQSHRRDGGAARHTQETADTGMRQARLAHRVAPRARCSLEGRLFAGRAPCRAPSRAEYDIVALPLPVDSPCQALGRFGAKQNRTIGSKDR